jgi:hypothetical protein
MFAFSLQLAIVVNSFSIYYHGFWIGVFLIVGGSVMMVAAFRLDYPLIHLTRIYAVNIGFGTAGLVFLSLIM